MRFKKRKDIIQFLDLSVILFLRSDLNDFKTVFERNSKYFQRNGMEVVILFYQAIDKVALLNFIEKYPFINFKIISIEYPGLSNCNSAINLGIKKSSFNNILVLDPHSELVTDVVYQSRYILSFYSRTFVVTLYSLADSEDALEDNSSLILTPYSSIMFSKTDAISIKGYDESLDTVEGGINMGNRLELLGLRKMKVVEAKVNLTKVQNGIKDRIDQGSDGMPTNTLKRINYPQNVIANNKSFGDVAHELLWSWKTHKSFSELKKFLKLFVTSSTLNNQICEKKYGIIALIQVRDDSKNVRNLLPHLENYCDGIVLLDDGSTDDSYEIASSEKLLLKVKKYFKGYFDDLGNRNDLLKLANFFKAEWFLFIDVDERFDIRYSNVRSYANKGKADVYRFHLVDLWDNPNTYRVDIPDRRNNGVTNRARMFRNKGSMQISVNRELHFSAVPYSNNTEIAEILLLHFGNFDKKTRDKKYRLYTAQDPDGRKNGFSYDFLKDSEVILKKVDDLVLDDIETLY